ncbi:hypothetical protein CYPRO_2129 [Cyclonatronum proteinivorum]|uniref:Uncharacterized protein n=1 Tax=Cyclonatronum proteinivorum TaxID=1457365 RepID=A0A345ULM6_9BACT|nr:hypothetical protein CYPRO_2129 [Cyclonatronum proteinivorum]
MRMQHPFSLKAGTESVAFSGKKNDEFPYSEFKINLRLEP